MADARMPTLPPGATVYRQTREFEETTVPDALLADHRTKAGTWGRIVVLEGTLVYVAEEPHAGRWVLRPGSDGIIAPGATHRVQTEGPVRFRVEFLRVD